MNSHKKTFDKAKLALREYITNNKEKVDADFKAMRANSRKLKNFILLNIEYTEYNGTIFQLFYLEYSTIDSSLFSVNFSKNFIYIEFLFFIKFHKAF